MREQISGAPPGAARPTARPATANPRPRPGRHPRRVFVAALLIVSGLVALLAPAALTPTSAGASVVANPETSGASSTATADPSTSPAPDPAADAPAADPSADDPSAAGGDAPVTGTDPPPRSATGALRWVACLGGDVAPLAPGPYECARWSVPRRAAEPQGAQVSLGLIRRPATDQGRRVGSLFVNPGGPGGSGVSLAQAIANQLDPELRARYDIVGFDPRGVGASSGLACGVGDDLLARPVTGQDRYGRDLAAACEREAPGLLGALSTVAAARDLDALRSAVGDDRLNYLGYSYGATLGAVYAELFPSRVGRLVLDGATAPNLSYVEWVSAQLNSFQEVLGRFFAACDAEPSCPLRGGAEATWRRLSALAATDGLATPNGPPLDRHGLLDATLSLLYLGSEYDKVLAGLLENAAAGAASGLAELAARSSGISAAAYYGVVCGDDGRRIDEAELAARVAALRATAPDFAEHLREVLTCAALPAATTPRPRVALDASEVAPILVVATTHDPATPYQGSVAMTEALGNATLLSFEGDGHTVFLRANRCIDSNVTRYLLSGVTPPSGTRCRPIQDIGVVLVANDNGTSAGTTAVPGAGPGATVAALGIDSVAMGLLQVGDVVRTVNGVGLTSPIQLEETAQTGASLELGVWRDGRPLIIVLHPAPPHYWSA